MLWDCYYRSMNRKIFSVVARLETLLKIVPNSVPLSDFCVFRVWTRSFPMSFQKRFGVNSRCTHRWKTSIFRKFTDFEIITSVRGNWWFMIVAAVIGCVWATCNFATMRPTRHPFENHTCLLNPDFWILNMNLRAERLTDWTSKPTRGYLKKSAPSQQFR